MAPTRAWPVIKWQHTHTQGGRTFANKPNRRHTHKTHNILYQFYPQIMRGDTNVPVGGKTSFEWIHVGQHSLFTLFHLHGVSSPHTYTRHRFTRNASFLLSHSIGEFINPHYHRWK